MSCFRECARLLLALVVLTGATSCSRLGQTGDEAQVAQAFDSWKSAVINHQTNQEMAYIPSHVDDYLHALNSPVVDTAPAATVPPSASPGVDLLLRTALEKKVPPDLRAHLTMAALLQRITERNLLSAHNVQQIALGHVSVMGNRASAEVYYQGTLTALRLPFVKEGDAWKIDVMALLPYAEVLMRVDRAIKGETEAEQVDQIVSKLPVL